MISYCECRICNKIVATKKKSAPYFQKLMDLEAFAFELFEFFVPGFDAVVVVAVVIVSCLLYETPSFLRIVVVCISLLSTKQNDVANA